MEGDFPRLHLNDIEDMLIHVVQNRIFNLKGEEIVYLAATLHIDRQLLERRLMRSLEKFVGGREYGEDLRLLQRTI
ncbi:hypothetical protein Tco_0196346 [Tanacetum coccineum]